jgi:hypothetical protein
MKLVPLTTLVLALAAPSAPAAVAAQYDQRGAPNRPINNVSTTDIQRLQDQVYDASNELSRLRSRDRETADRLQTRLDDARDDVVYLRVKMRRQGSVSRDEYDDVRDAIAAIRSEARTDVRQGTSSWPNGSGNPADSRDGAYGNNGGYGSGSGTGSGNWPTGTVGQSSRRNEVPAGTELDVRLERELDSSSAQVEDRFTATTLADLYQGNEVLIPAGSTLRGVVSSVTRATRTERKGAMTVAFDQLTINGALRLPENVAAAINSAMEATQLAIQALTEVDAQLVEADRLRTEASDLILQNQNQKAMEKLSGCFSTWQHAQESVLKTAQLLRLDLATVRADGQPLTTMVREFADQLRQIKSALENRDFVQLNDILTYEAPQTTARWRGAVASLRTAIAELR